MWKWLSKNNDGEALNLSNLGKPWENRPSLYEIVAAHIDQGTGQLNSSCPDLPDESRDPNALRWAPGAQDGVSTFHFQHKPDVELTNALMNHLEETVRNTSGEAFKSLYETAKAAQAISYVADFAPRAKALKSHRKSIAQLGRHLLHNAADREVVKLALVLIQISGDSSDHNTLFTIGAHDEFTLFALIALSQTGGDFADILKMAKSVSGWGRVQCVSRMEFEIEDPLIRRWLVTEGYKNDVMIEYLAAVCAKTGHLHDQLAGDVDDELMTGAADLLSALSRGGPMPAMTGYEESAASCIRFLELLKSHRSPKLDWLLAARDINAFSLTLDKAANRPDGWDESVCGQCRRLIADIRARPIWLPLIMDALDDRDPVIFARATMAAPLFAIDTWNHRFMRLQAGEDHWSELLETPDFERVKRVLEHARSNINLSRIATGAGDALGLGKEFAEHQKLDSVVRGLGRWPQQGEEFIKTAMRSPVIRNRWGAVQTLLAWPPETRGGCQSSMEAALKVEPDEKLREGMKRVLAGEVEVQEAASE